MLAEFSFEAKACKFKSLAAFALIFTIGESLPNLSLEAHGADGADCCLKLLWLGTGFVAVFLELLSCIFMSLLLTAAVETIVF